MPATPKEGNKQSKTAAAQGALCGLRLCRAAPNRKFRAALAGLSLLAVASPPAGALAQTYPSRPITIIVPSAAGGPTDALTRVIAEYMRGALGQPVVVENQGTAGGTVAVGRVAHAAAE